ncbi:hypothetical protein EDC94DRAFT_580734 [Helicostylum pulchrum]|nr:hypothetical protein EDC94DRAFT_580734 [Helicostylum pulchrum]
MIFFKVVKTSFLLQNSTIYKEFIINKTLETLEKKSEEAGIAKCKDCSKEGHKIGSSSLKRKQSQMVKLEKKEAKRARTGTANAICSSCRLPGHSTSRSKSCKNHMRTKDELMKEELGDGGSTFTRK